VGDAAVAPLVWSAWTLRLSSERCKASSFNLATWAMFHTCPISRRTEDKITGT
jgi:hypothetical protein